MQATSSHHSQGPCEHLLFSSCDGEEYIRVSEVLVLVASGGTSKPSGGGGGGGRWGGGMIYCLVAQSEPILPWEQERHPHRMQFAFCWAGLC